MTAAPAIVGAEGYKAYSDLPDVQVDADGKYVEDFFDEDTFSLLAKYADRKVDLPQNHDEFRLHGWKDITDQRQVDAGNRAREYVKNGIKIIYEEGEVGARGFRGVDHYHIINPNATNNFDMYLDKYGNPTPKNSKQSHILKTRR